LAYSKARPYSLPVDEVCQFLTLLVGSVVDTVWW